MSALPGFVPTLLPSGYVSVPRAPDRRRTDVSFVIATEPGRSEHPNEDFAAVSARGAVLLDGASAPPGVEIGCSHGVAWYTRRLGALLLAEVEAGSSLRDALASAITSASAMHASTCDLDNQETPSATVVVVRPTTTELEYLVLSDSVLLVAEEEGTRLVADTRLDDLRRELARAPYTTQEGTVERVRERYRRSQEIRVHRNVPGGFWTAGADPRAADEAIIGVIPIEKVRGLAAMSDGAARAVEVFGAFDWGGALTLVLEKGPRALVEKVRALEAADPEQRAYPRGKERDDATVVLWRPD